MQNRTPEERTVFYGVVMMALIVITLAFLVFSIASHFQLEPAVRITVLVVVSFLVGYIVSKADERNEYILLGILIALTAMLLMSAPVDGGVLAMMTSSFTLGMVLGDL